MKTGTVKCFNNDRGFGFITPNEPCSDGRDVFFHKDSGYGFREDYLGNVEIGQPSTANRVPQTGERIIYAEIDGRRGPKARVWALPEEWDRAQSIIAARPWPTWPLVQILSWRNSATLNGPEIIWRGFSLYQMALVSKQYANDTRLEWQMLRVHGWESIGPSSFENATAPTAEQQERIDRFILAQLIEEGDILRHQSRVAYYHSAVGIFRSGDQYCVDEIGCALLAKFQSAGRTYEAFTQRSKELPEMPGGGRFRTDYVCAELLGLPFELVSTCSWWLYCQGDRTPSQLAARLRGALPIEVHGRTELDRYRKLVKTHSVPSV